MSEKTIKRKGAFPLILCLSLLPGALFLVLTVLPLLPGPVTHLSSARFMLAVSVFVVLVVLAAFITFIIFLLPAVITRRWTSGPGAWCLWGLLATPLTIGAMFLSEDLRQGRMASTAEKGNAIAQALERWKSDKGEYPESLRALVPEYLAEIPDTGIAAYPSFGYRKRSREEELFSAYELSIECSRALLNWDRMVYWPEGGYPKYMYGGSVRPVGRWAYVHE